MMIFRKQVNQEAYFIVTYWLKCKTNLRDAAWDLAIGQSVGNPNVRNSWESDELFDKPVASERAGASEQDLHDRVAPPADAGRS